ncbi:Syntaxin VAM3 [Nakaseomyces bracarensis]|uniref:Syntaxin VAM3 n=1 Tax=Nakaseomyces bracarensis TaxID=273131 RepID=A0ABR4NV48_9SACH
MEDTEAHHLSQYAQHVKELEKEVNKVGTRRDSEQVRTHISELLKECLELSQKNTNSASAVGSKLLNDYNQLNKEVKRLQAEYKEKMGVYPLKALPIRQNESSSGYTSMPVNEDTPLLEEEQKKQREEQQRLFQIQELQQDRIPEEELDFYTIVQEDRSQQISRIHSSVQEVNAIFKQLGTLVKEQATQVDSVDENISHFGDNMKRAHEQLNRADEHQRQRNRCGLLTLVIVIIMTLLIILGALS